MTTSTPQSQSDADPLARGSGELVPLLRLGAADPSAISATLYGSGLGVAFEGYRTQAYTLPYGSLTSTTYQWFVDGKPAVSDSVDSAPAWDAIQPSQFIPFDADVGKKLSFIVTGIDKNGATVSIGSDTSVLIANVNDLPQGTLTIDSGAQTPGSTLHATSTITDGDGMGTLLYQWKADGQSIAGATGANWTLTPAQAGRMISVTASYVDGHGHAESVASDAVAQPHVNHAGQRSIVGSLAAGQTLHAQVIDADGTGDIYYQWSTSDDGLSWSSVLSTGSSLALGDKAPALVKMQLIYADNYGTVEAESIIQATDQAETIKFPYQGYTLNAGGGNDTIYFSGAARVDGGAGLDTFIPTTAYVLSELKTFPSNIDEWGLLTFTPGTSVKLVNVERVKFSDVSMALDIGIDGAAGNTYRLYQAAFNRVPDKIGAGFWINQLDKGLDLATIADAFVHSAEFTTLYGSNPSNADLVGKFYQNILHRAPEAGGYQFWTDVLDRHAVTVADVLVNFSNSTENVAALVGVLSNGVAYTPYAG